MAAAESLDNMARFASRIVKIKVTSGDDPQTFHVHEAIIRERSQYFRAAFGDWKEGTVGEITLFDEDPETVSDYLQYIYSGKVDSKPFINCSKDDREASMRQLMHLYILGENIQDDEFCNEVISTLAHRCGEEDDQGTSWFSVDEAVRLLYDGTHAHSPARRFVVDMHVQNGSESRLECGIDKHHSEFLLDLSRAFMSAKEKRFRCPFEQRHKWFKGGNKDGDASKD